MSQEAFKYAFRVREAQSAHRHHRGPGTSRRDLPKNDENRRDLSRRSDRMPSAFALVRETPAQDPAYKMAAWRDGHGYDE